MRSTLRAGSRDVVRFKFRPKEKCVVEHGQENRHTNRLAQETSPYLLQHQHNPVDWYAWGPEAFEAARAQNKPIFLSVGYSTCYWCHVMERQCFENETVAKVMNELFINIKVDREERPDVDQLYMLAVQLLTRHGGWPMSVWLMPDLRPFYGGTYFPPTDAHGRPGFVTVCRAIADAFHNRKGDVEGSATQLVSILKQMSQPPGADRELVMDEEFVAGLIERSVGDYEPRFGGFGGAPKFPRETLLEMLLTFTRGPDSKSEIANRKSRVLPMALHALDAMAAGGIRDHLGGGFHRYSTDEKWLVPHFEIMLYDNAMLGWCYVEAYRQTEDVKYANVARGIFNFVLREMTSPDGAFYTALDAEVDAMEGGNYLWTAEEVNHVLEAEDGKIFNAIYGLDRGPNFADPHQGGGVPDKNVLYLAQAIDAEDEDHVAGLRQKLYEVRQKRKQPLLDTKVITSWNALMIRALAYGGQVLGEQRYLDAASRAAEFVLKHHRTSDGGLYRASRHGRAKYAAFLDDYAFLVQALIALRDAKGLEKWKDEAATLATTMTQKFDDQVNGAFFFTEEGAKDLIVRQKTASDSPLPSGNAVAAMVMMALDQPDAARDVLRVFARQLYEQAEGMSSMLQAALLYVRQHGELAVQASAKQQGSERLMTPQQLAKGVVGVKPEFVTARQLNLVLDILEPFHLNAHDASAGLVGTELTVSDGIEVQRVDYPPGEERRFAFADQPLRVYAGKVTIAVHLKRDIARGQMLSFGLTYQACEESSCLPPVTKQVEVKTQ